MARTRSFTAIQGIPSLLLLGLLIFFPNDSSAHLFVRGPLNARSSHKGMIKRTESVHLSEINHRSFIFTRDHLANETTRVLPADGCDNDGSLHQISTVAWDGPGMYVLRGQSGVSAQQISVVDDQYVIIFDKAEHNPLKTSNGNNAWSALYDSSAHTVRALDLVTNSFCAGKLYLCSSYVLQHGVFILVDHRRRVA